MQFIEIKEEEWKEITMFLVNAKIIFHPSISPKGAPDFSNERGRKNVLILDRNIVTPLISLLKNGVLKDEHLLKVIASLMFWSQINNLSVTSGLALSEYAHHKMGNEEASLENDLFLKSFNYYSPNVWLEMAVGRLKTIEALQVDVRKSYTFKKEYDHYKMHYLEMLKIAQLYFDTSLSVEEKIANFHQWVYKNLMVCRYTISYLALLLAGRINTFHQTKSFDKVLLRCENQAWDLSYLSLWSTFYFNEDKSDTNYLFATLDKGLKQIFIGIHDATTDLHSSLFGEKVGKSINESMLRTFKRRSVPKISKEAIDRLTKTELEKLGALDFTG